MRTAAGRRERELAADCFGGRVRVHVGGRRADEFAAAAIERLRRIDRRLSRFRPDSELCRLNRDRREEVPASPLILDLVEAVREAAERTGGLVDGTLLDELELAGYVNSMAFGASPLPSVPLAHTARPEAAQGGRRIEARGDWSTLSVDRARGLVRRPPGVRVDSGGVGKGLAADQAGEALTGFASFCVDCGGDMLIGGTAGLPRAVFVEDPLGGDQVCEFELTAGAVATSGVTRRAWLGTDGSRRHHLIDPRTGEPARTGVVQVTALAPTATEAETLAKAALLAGPELAPGWLPHGGAFITEDAAVVRLDPPEPALAFPQAA
jgi:FAD:protein FMN transferase